MDNGIKEKLILIETFMNKFNSIITMKKSILILSIILFGFKEGFSQKIISTSEYVRKGERKDTVYYQDSLFTGIAIKKAENGQIIAEEHYENGIANGLWKEWYKTGKRKFEGRFSKGKNEGEWIQWYEDGKIQRKLTFENGIYIDK